jgi:hypothetical protein
VLLKLVEKSVPHRHRRLDGWMRIVANQLKSLEFKPVDGLHRWIQLQLRQRGGALDICNLACSKWLRRRKKCY